MRSEEYLVTHSDSINYLLQRRLSFLLRYGMSFLFILGLIVIVALYFVKVPDVLEGKFSLSSSNPPKTLIAKVNGRITDKLVADKQNVKEGQLLVRLESSANYKEVEMLEKELHLLKNYLDSNFLDSIKMIEVNAKFSLGELQPVYEQFKKSNNELFVALSRGQFLEEKHIIENRLFYLNQGKDQLLRQKLIYKREYDLANDAWQVDSVLRKQGSLTLTELRASESFRLQKKLSLNNIAQSLIANETSINEIEQQLINLEKSIAVQKNSFYQNFGVLWVSISDWKTKYTLYAPFDGQVNFNRNIYNGLQVLTGESVLYISPSKSDWIAEMLIPQQNFGKIKLGQKVILKFDGYNFEEFGAVEGSIKNIANIPQELKSNEGNVNMFLVQVSINNGFKTNYQKNIKPLFGLNGQASIVLDDKSVLEKLFLDKFKAIFVFQ